MTRAVADKLGVKVEFKETNWDSLLAGLKANRFDIVVNQISLETPERRASFDVSASYSYDGAMMLTRANDERIHSLADIKGLLAAQTLSSGYGQMAQAAGAKIVPVGGMAQAVQLLQQKRADLIINGSLALLDYLKSTPDSGLKIAWQAPASDKIGTGLAVNKGNDEALSKISAAVQELKAEGKLKEIGEKFFGENVSQP